MHRRLRRQLEEALGPDYEAPPPLRTLLRKIDQEYRRADGARDSLEHALALLSDLLRRQPEAPPGPALSPKTRSAALLFDQVPFAALICDADRKVTAWNAAAHHIFGFPSSEAIGRELSMLVFPGDDVGAARARTLLRQSLESGGTQQHLQTTPTRGGVARLCEWTLVSLRDAKGRGVGTAVLVQGKDPPGARPAEAPASAGDSVADPAPGAPAGVPPARGEGLAADLQQALAREELRSRYLPIVDAATRRIAGFEALIRWEHPTLGAIEPERFLPFAEESGLILPIGRWLLGEASRDVQRCGCASPEPLTLNLDLSPRQLQHDGLLQQVDELLAEQALDPRHLAFGLSEAIVRESGHEARIAELRARGVRLYMDGFVSGATSLNALLRLQFDCLKIDRSLYAGAAPRDDAPEIVRTIVSLASELGLGVVAEGIETAEQFGFVREVGCSAAQGPYFSPPVDGEGARALLERSASW